MPNSQTIFIATRKSELALIQSNMIKAALTAELARTDDHERSVKLLPMLSTGDKVTDRHLLEIGGKGLFTKEIEEALLSGKAQIAMHSLKDMPAEMPEGLMIGAVLPREDFRDALLCKHASNSVHDLPQNATLGTSSPRRAAQMKKLRPDLRITPFRGNVPTRLQKLADDEVEATILAVAGLKRLSLERHIAHYLEPDEMLPAIGQGIIAIQCRRDDHETLSLLERINHQHSWHQMLAERAILKQIEGDCHTPLAGLAEITGNRMNVRGMILNDDGSKSFEVERSGTIEDAEPLGREVGKLLKEQSSTIWS